MNYVYVGDQARVYSSVNGEPCSFIAIPGDVREFTDAPDSQWMPEDSQKAPKAPVAPSTPEPDVSIPEPETEG